MRRVAVVAGLSLAMLGLSWAPAVAQERGPYAPIVGLCIRKVVNLPLFDLPDQPIDLMLGGQVECPSRGG